MCAPDFPGKQLNSTQQKPEEAASSQDMYMHHRHSYKER
jgi:hypothetical protein